MQAITMAEVWEQFTAEEKKLMCDCLRQNDPHLHLGIMALVKVNTVLDALIKADRLDISQATLVPISAHHDRFQYMNIGLAGLYKKLFQAKRTVQWHEDYD